MVASAVYLDVAFYRACRTDPGPPAEWDAGMVVPGDGKDPEGAERGQSHVEAGGLRGQLRGSTSFMEATMSCSTEWSARILSYRLSYRNDITVLYR